MDNRKVTKLADLRDILKEEIDKLRAGETTPANINAITNATGKIFASIKLEMEYARMIGEKPNIEYIRISKETEG